VPASIILFSSLASRRLAGPFLVALPIVLVVALAAFELATWDRVTPGVVALGEPLGGLRHDQAAERIEQRAARLLERRVRVVGSSADQTWDRSARELGLRLQVADAVDAAYAVGRQGGFSPLQRLGAQLGALLRGADVGLGDPVEMAALEAAIRRMAEAVDRPVLDASVSIDRQGNVRTSPAQVGRSVDVGASAERLARALLGNVDTVELAVRETPPRVTDAMAEPARVQAERMLGPADQPPLVLRFQDQQLPLTRADVGPNAP
jgi:hypothetical protein